MTPKPFNPDLRSKLVTKKAQTLTGGVSDAISEHKRAAQERAQFAQSRQDPLHEGLQ
jgi:hypothetical protein